ncbi:hypothetical protein HI914_03188 [Erysiphe necator]|nr:hypothetical protein HI914_03188 [Erysiphe necator]
MMKSECRRRFLETVLSQASISADTWLTRKFFKPLNSRKMSNVRLNAIALVSNASDTPAAADSRGNPP